MAAWLRCKVGQQPCNRVRTSHPEQNERTLLTVAASIELDISSMVRATNAVSQHPPFLPPVQRCTLMPRLSMNSLLGAFAMLAWALKRSPVDRRSDQRTTRSQGAFFGS